MRAWLMVMVMVLSGCSTTQLVGVAERYSGPMEGAPLEGLVRGTQVTYSLKGENPDFPDFMPHTTTVYLRQGEEGFVGTANEAVRFDQINLIRFDYMRGQEQKVPTALRETVTNTIYWPAAVVCIAAGACPMR
mgnify:CR=1 FL=1